jgi:hypothetical protein
LLHRSPLDRLSRIKMKLSLRPTKIFHKPTPSTPTGSGPSGIAVLIPPTARVRAAMDQQSLNPPGFLIHISHAGGLLMGSDQQRGGLCATESMGRFPWTVYSLGSLFAQVLKLQKLGYGSMMELAWHFQNLPFEYPLQTCAFGDL